jgi:dynein heavy chain
MKWKFVKFQASDMEIKSWTANQLPTDEYSQENGVLAMQSRRWPLSIDPQIQANKWLKNMFKDLTILKITEKDFLKNMSDAVYYGKYVLLEDIGETLDPGLNSII